MPQEALVPPHLCPTPVMEALEAAHDLQSSHHLAAALQQYQEAQGLWEALVPPPTPPPCDGAPGVRLLAAVGRKL